MLYDTPRRRRLLVPLAILLVGGGIAFWGAQRETKRSEEIRQTVLALCREIRAGQDVTQRVQALTAAPNPLLLRALENASMSAKGIDDISVEISVGDVKDGSAFAGAATHIATIRVAGVNALALRVRHNGDGKPIELLGYFAPTPQ